MQASGMKPDFHTYCVVLDGLCKTGHVDEAFQLFHAMEPDGTDLHIVMYTIILDGVCKSRRLDGARDLLKNLSLKGLDPDVKTYNIIITGLLSEGLLIETNELFEKMKDNGCRANTVSYNILQELLKGGHYKDALVYHEEMVRRGFLLDSSAFSILLGSSTEKQKNPSLLMLMLKIDPDGKQNMEGG
nr:pentatricopeptide repeat-containing protein At3g22470, mitochondrial-like [Coffea arabica]